MSTLTDSQMSWHEREHVRTRVAQLRRDDTEFAITEARLILTDIPADPPLVCAQRRQDLEDAVTGWTFDRKASA